MHLPTPLPVFAEATRSPDDSAAQAIPLATVMDLLLDAICVVDKQGRFVFVSAAAEQIFGYTPDEMKGRQMIDMVHPPDQARTLQRAREIMSGTASSHFENRYVRKDGHVVDIMWSARWSEADQVRIAVARDVTELKRAGAMQAALLEISEAAHATEDLPALFQRIHQVIGELLPAKNFFVALHDHTTDVLSFPYFVDEHDAQPLPRPLDSGTLSSRVIRTGQPLLLTPDTETQFPDGLDTIVGKASLNWLGTPLVAPDGIIGALVVQSYSGDVRYSVEDMALLNFVSSQVAAAIVRKQAETRLQHIARHDPLTDLPNRALLHDRLQTALAESGGSGSPLSLLYIDLDGFKQVNDRYGHAVGDLLLGEVARRIRAAVRESDTVGRVGGDEFVVLLATPAQHVPAIAEKIRSALEQPFDFAQPPLHISASIGVANHPAHGTDDNQLLGHADRAMYVAKGNGGNQVG